MFTIAKLKKQNKQTWGNLQKRLNSLQFDYSWLFASEEVRNFVQIRPFLLEAQRGIYTQSKLTTTALLLVSKNIFVETSMHKLPPNGYNIFVGFPGTGKYLFEERCSS